MRLRFDRVAVDGEPGVAAGDVVVVPTDDDQPITWSVRNPGGRPVALHSVSLVFRLEGVVAPLRMFRHGFQSWSACDVATFSVDDDPARTAGARSLVIAMHHADPRPPAAGELRSELVTVLADATGALALVGFLGGATHAGTLRLRPGTAGDVELWAEAQFGGAVLGPDESRSLHPVVIRHDGAGELGASALLDGWSLEAGRAAGARTAAQFQVGWCSWYHYFHAVTENDIRSNLAQAAPWPFDVFQVDDGYQAAIGDWLATNPKFPRPLDELASTIAAAGRTPGIWLAPFLVAPDSEVAANHPEWLARWRDGRPLVGSVNEPWGGAVHVLDTTQPEVVDHLEHVAGALVGSGFPYLKLDFTYAPGLPGVFADPSRTSAERVRAGFDAIRRGAGDDTFLLGCGAPLGAAIGVVDGMRVGPDVAPWWELPDDEWAAPGYERTAPATANAWRSVVARSFLHRRFWLNDPDCIMLRAADTRLSAAAADGWALNAAMTGGMMLVSDDLALVDDDRRRAFAELVELARSVDVAAMESDGHPPRCRDLFDAHPPSRLSGAGRELVTDPATGAASLQTSLW